MGENETAAKEYLQKNYKEDMSLEDIEVLACKALLSTLEEGFDKSKLEIALVSVEEKKFRLATPAEFQKVLSKL
jgi:proteasome alpha subunit